MSAGTSAAPIPTRAAWLLAGIDGGPPARESHPDVLDAPVLPGSTMKIVALIAALERHVIDRHTTHMCRRRIDIDGHQYVCSHPDLKRPLTAAEALAYSCND